MHLRTLSSRFPITTGLTSRPPLTLPPLTHFATRRCNHLLNMADHNPYHPTNPVNESVTVPATWAHRTLAQTQDYLEFLESRHGTRCFDPTRPVPSQLLRRAIEVASNSASSQNNRPWSLIVLTGKQRDALSEALLQVFDENNDAVNKGADYRNKPNPLPPRIKQQIDAYGKGHYEDYLGYDRTEAPARRAASRNNYKFFGAPVQIIVHLPRGAVEGTFLDTGCFLSTLLLAFHGQGLGAMLQFSVVSYAKTVRRVLGLGEDVVLASGVAVGYPVEGYRQWWPQRLGVDAFTEWRGWEEEGDGVDKGRDRE